MRFIKSIIFILVIAFFAGIYGIFHITSAPNNFPTPYILTVNKGDTFLKISTELRKDNIIRSMTTFKLYMRLFGNEKSIEPGEYLFSYPVSALDIAFRISGRQFGIEKSKVTIPEGFTNTDIAKRLVEVFPNFDSTTFLTLAADKQGYLFPDTYSFYPNISPDKVIETMSQNFVLKTNDFNDVIKKSGRTYNEIIVMASLIEKEASGNGDRALIAGILWKRIDHGMPLQIDADKITYKQKGLPKNPIANPGALAIQAALNPIYSSALYYLHDKAGAIHYADTYTDHQKNIRKYLK